MIRHRLTDEQWDCISDLFPKAQPTGRPPAERRRVIDGILWVLGRLGSDRNGMKLSYKPNL